jgi:hypothetical protein
MAYDGYRMSLWTDNDTDSITPKLQIDLNRDFKHFKLRYFFKQFSSYMGYVAEGQKLLLNKQKECLNLFNDLLKKYMLLGEL